MLEGFGIAFAGYYVYPRELALLAKSVLPLPINVLGRFFNVIGPFVADVPVAAQLTGVSDVALLPGFRRLAARLTDRRLWLCTNTAGADELVSFADNVLHGSNGLEDVHLTPGRLDLGPGSLEDLVPAASSEGAVAQFEAILAGDGPRPAVETVCLNAAAIAVLGGVAAGWPEAVRGARAAMRSGHAARLVAAVRGCDPYRTGPERGAMRLAVA
jgi:anthranilate phosphoribosyltransferase